MTPQAFSPGNVHGLLLYDFGASPCARRCRITLLEKGLRWDTESIDLSRLEQRNPAYLAINPNGFVPSLGHGERVVYESNVITEYLDDVFPDPPLYPSDPWERARVKMWQSAEAAMAKDYRTLTYQRVMGPVLRLTRSLDEALAAARRSTEDPADLAWERRVWRLEVLTPAEEADFEDRLRRWLDVLDESLRGHDFLVGERFSQAEISVYPRVAMFPYLGIPIRKSRHPGVARWVARLAGRPSFAATLSEQDKGLARLARTPVLPWLARTLRKPESAHSWSERARLRLLKGAFARVLPARGAAEAPAVAPRPLRRPCTGEVPPADAPTRALAPLSEEHRAAPLTLYDYAASPHARRIRILMREKGLSWKTAEVDMGRMVHKAPDYLALNPNGELPALRHGDRVLYDSQAIAEYLDAVFDTAGSPRLHPRDAFLAAEMRMWLALEAGTHKEFRPLFYLRVVRPSLLAAGVRVEELDEWVAPGVHPSHRAWLRATLEGRPRFDTSEELARTIIAKKLDGLERHLRARYGEGHEFLVGDAFSLADAAWFTRIDSLPALGLPLAEERHPQLRRWAERIRARPSVAE